LLALSANAASPTERAEAIARAQPRVSAQFSALKNEAQAVKDRALRRELLGLLKGPRLEIFARRPQEAAIMAQLKAAGLLDPAAAKLFPDGAMPFIAAPGGVWLGHHSYPGGLVDHTLFNLRSGLGLAAAYRRTYKIEIDEDAVRAAAIMHDMGKTAALPWNADGTLPAVEMQVAGTGLHHIISISEALARGWPSRLVVCVASAHSPPLPGPDLDKLVSYLRAAAIISGKPNAAAGLTEDGKALAAPAPIEAFITHIDDHDYVLTEPAAKAASAKLAKKDPWSLDEARAKTSDVSLYVRSGEITASAGPAGAGTKPGSAGPSHSPAAHP
jgi:hypothetical protein